MDTWKTVAAEFGEWVQGRRKARRLSIRAAASLGGFSEGRWRQLEKGGYRVDGNWVSPEPGDDTLLGIARALDIDPRDVFERAGRDPDDAPTDDEPTGTGHYGFDDLTDDEYRQVVQYAEFVRAQRRDR